MTLKHDLSGLRNIINNTRGRTREEIILAVKAWEIQNREELQQLLRDLKGSNQSYNFGQIDLAIVILGVEPHGK